MNMRVQLLDTTPFWTGALAEKTQGLAAKHMSTVVTDDSFLDKLLLETLEGVGPTRLDAMICLGALGDVWLQDPAKLLKKYDLKSVDAQGWMQFTPKPENQVEFFEITDAHVAGGANFLQGTWGKEIDGIKNLQAFKVGDFVARQTYDHSDQWVVARKIWLNSYTAK